MDQSREDLLWEKKLREALVREREISDKLYSGILVQKIVYAAIGAISMSVLTALLYLVVKGKP